MSKTTVNFLKMIIIVKFSQLVGDFSCSVNVCFQPMAHTSPLIHHCQNKVCAYQNNSMYNCIACMISMTCKKQTHIQDGLCHVKIDVLYFWQTYQRINFKS